MITTDIHTDIRYNPWWIHVTIAPSEMGRPIVVRLVPRRLRSEPVRTDGGVD